MKVKLLKKLRKKFAKKYTIYKIRDYTDKYKIYLPDGSSILYSDIALAKKKFMSLVRGEINSYIFMHRIKGNSFKKMKYYPW